MKELVVISGKGGTGKTSITASFAVLAGRPVVADCDVDAADLHLVLSPVVRERHEFHSGHEAVIQPAQCNGCGACMSVCRFGAVVLHGDGQGEPIYSVDPLACEGCGVCVHVCPAEAIEFPERRCGSWMISQTRCGPMVHARLGAAAENSGKLVSVVRQEARRIAEQGQHDIVIIDGPPGIGCPVIASVTGAALVLIVTEPTVSGEHDLERVFALTRHFCIPTAVCVNKWDLNPEATQRIEEKTIELGGHIAGRIRYDRSVTRAQLEEKAAVELDSPAGADIRELWKTLSATKYAGSF